MNQNLKLRNMSQIHKIFQDEPAEPTEEIDSYEIGNQKMIRRRAKEKNQRFQVKQMNK